MSIVDVKGQWKLMGDARAKRAEQSALKSDLSGIQTLALSKDLTKAKDDLKVQINKVEELTKQLKKMIKKKYDADTTIVEVIHDIEASRETNEKLEKYQKDARVDLLAAGDEAFDRAKA
ncbi:hypothetical protein RYX36_032898 [Vicia faba]